MDEDKTTENNLLTVEEVGTILRINTDTVRRLIKRKSNPLPAINIGSGDKKPQYRIYRTKLDQFLSNQSRNA